MATGFDPLHLAEVFGISNDTAIRYAVNARQLTRADASGSRPWFPLTGRIEVARRSRERRR